MTASEAEKRHASIVECMRIEHHVLEQCLREEHEAHEAHVSLARSVPLVALAAFLVGAGLGVLGALAVWG